MDALVKLASALSYAYERCRRVEDWKFNKARQHWLLRNLWSEHAVNSKTILAVRRCVKSMQVPGSYVPLVIEYLVGIRGSAREASAQEFVVGMTLSYLQKLIVVCTSKLSTSESTSVQADELLNGSTGVRPMTDQQLNASRAQCFLQALRENSSRNEFD